MNKKTTATAMITSTTATRPTTTTCTTTCTTTTTSTPTASTASAASSSSPTASVAPTAFASSTTNKQMCERFCCSIGNECILELVAQQHVEHLHSRCERGEEEERKKEEAEAAAEELDEAEAEKITRKLQLVLTSLLKARLTPDIVAMLDRPMQEKKQTHRRQQPQSPHQNTQHWLHYFQPCIMKVLPHSAGELRGVHTIRAALIFNRCSRPYSKHAVSFQRTLQVYLPSVKALSSKVFLPTSFPARRCLQTTRALFSDDVTVNLPPVAESISEGEIASFEKDIGDFVEQDEAVLMIETDKTSVPVNAPQAGYITEFLVSEGDTVPIGAELFKLKPGAAPAADTVSKPKPSTEEPIAPSSSSSTTAEPASQPIDKPTPSQRDTVVSPAPSKPPQTQAQQSATGEGVTRVKMTRMRKRTAERLKESQNTAAMLTTFNEIDMSNIIAFRNKHKDEFFKKHGIKLGFMSAFAKAAAWALQHEPAVNACRIQLSKLTKYTFVVIDTDNENIVYHDFVNISVAVATPKGLVVPVVRDVQKMNFLEIEKEIARLGKKARDGELAIEDMEGGTFTISNGGVFGSLMGTPIINPPQSAILGMHATKERPVAVHGKVEIRPMMYVALTYDHRLIDGREAVTFLRLVKEAVEDPRIILLD
eukprot:gene10531-2656_t